MTVSEPYYTDKPRYAGEHWRVVVRKGCLIETHGFKAEENAKAFVTEMREQADG